MEIISIPFAILAIASVFILYLLNPRHRVLYLTFLSCIFIAGINYYLLIYIIAYSLLNYGIGINIPGSGFKKTLFRAGIVFNLLQLVVLKYASFAIDPALQVFNLNFSVSKLSEIIIPLGISYFTLQGIGYLINVKMGWEKPEKKFIDFLFYIIFYPKFLSGPVERSNHFLPQIKEEHQFNEQQVNEGLRIALIGFFKKVVIANQLGIIVTGVYTDVNVIQGLNLWLVILIQPLYLYFDFSGYTDIAIGLAKMYGIDLLPNFNKPFLSENVTTFWKRFHMSLSFWFNDYVFKQISFRYRKWGVYASYFGVFVTFILFGVWHGAGWNFMVLGLIQALAINYEFFTKKERTKVFSKLPGLLRIWTGRAVTYFFFGLSLVFFFSPDLKTAITYFEKLIDLNPGLDTLEFGLISILALTFSIIFLFIEYLNQDYKVIFSKIEQIWIGHRYLRITLYYIMVILIMSQIGKKLTFVYQTF